MFQSCLVHSCINYCLSLQEIDQQYCFLVPKHGSHQCSADGAIFKFLFRRDLGCFCSMLARLDSRPLWWINVSSPVAMPVRKLVREWHVVVLWSSEIARGIHRGLTLWNPNCIVIMDINACDKFKSCIILFTIIRLFSIIALPSGVLMGVVPSAAGLPLGCK